jgi:hypothetical protein
MDEVAAAVRSRVDEVVGVGAASRGRIQRRRRRWEPWDRAARVDWAETFGLFFFFDFLTILFFYFFNYFFFLDVHQLFLCTGNLL